MKSSYKFTWKSKIDLSSLAILQNKDHMAALTFQKATKNIPRALGTQKHTSTRSRTSLGPLIDPTGPLKWSLWFLRKFRDFLYFTFSCRSYHVGLGWPKILKLMKINKGAPRCMFYGPTESRNMNKSFWDCFSTLLKAFWKYKENSEKYKGKMWKLVFYNFEPLQLFKTFLIALFCIPEVLTYLLTPILPYLYKVCVEWHMRQIWHF